MKKIMKLSNMKETSRRIKGHVVFTLGINGSAGTYGGGEGGGVIVTPPAPSRPQTPLYKGLLGIILAVFSSVPDP
jgi:hypothetical protein